MREKKERKNCEDLPLIELLLKITVTEFKKNNNARRRIIRGNEML